MQSHPFYQLKNLSIHRTSFDLLWLEKLHLLFLEKEDESQDTVRVVRGVHGVNDNDKGYSNEKMNIGTGSNKNNEFVNDTSLSNPVTLTSTNDAPTNTSHAHDVIGPEMVNPSVNLGFGKEDEFWSSSKSHFRSVYEVTKGGEAIRSDFYKVSSSDGTKENGNPNVTSRVSIDKNMLVNREHVNMENGWAAPVNEE
uniref:Uncharacterized protein n=1 Tax=Tanacetum cinerariifolium TaxID=118510 RepID=A0A699JWF0_TANCI|nr:hypothetical protein [Tanacetum cinerariifolium]